MRAAARTGNVTDKAYSNEGRLDALGQWSDANGIDHYADGSANTLSSGHLLMRYTGTALTINSTTAVTPAGMTCALAGGVTYYIQGLVVGQQGTTAAQQALRFHGVTLGSLNVGYLVSNFGDFGAAGIAANYDRVTAMDTDLVSSPAGGGIPNGNVFQWFFHGIIQPSAGGGGTLAIQARCTTSGADTWAFQPDSHALLSPIG